MYSKKRKIYIYITLYINNLKNMKKIFMLIFLKTNAYLPDKKLSNIIFTSSYQEYYLYLQHKF